MVYPMTYKTRFNCRLFISGLETDSFVFFFFAIHLRCAYVYSVTFFFTFDSRCENVQNGPIKSVEYEFAQKTSAARANVFFFNVLFFFSALLSSQLVKSVWFNETILWGSRPALAHISRLRPTRPLREGVPKLCAPIPNCQTRTRKVVHQII